MVADIQVGDRLVVERRLTWPNGPVDHRYESVVTRITHRRVYIARAWFDLNDPTREVKPRYIDYTTRVVDVLPRQGKAE